MTVVFTKSGVGTWSYTIPKTGWYTIQMLGYWDSTRVQINGVSVATAQCRVSNAAIGVANTCYFGQGTVLDVSIQASGGSVSIIDIN